MTREEAENFARSKTEMSAKLSNEMKVVGLGFVYELIRKIYDSIEAPKSCDGCKFYDKEVDYCNTYDSMIFGVASQWSCSDYEQKDTK